jgi:uncharacterized repeat protein (TIGR03943 family)
MRFRWLQEYWVTLFLLLSVTLVSLWLATGGKLSLYVHPRYILFTVIMSLLAVGMVAADLVRRHSLPKVGRAASGRSAMVGVLCALLCLGLLTLRPAGLTSNAAEQRSINSGALSLGSQSSLNDLTTAKMASEDFSIKEWASLLAQTTDADLFSGKQVNVTGFVSPAPDNNQDIFYVTRFVVTCCAVDARPIGVPVYKPHWRDTYRVDQWLVVQGVFESDPGGSVIPIVVTPQTLTVTSEPKNPYVY